MAKRSATLKQFLLRVHPDHFCNIPKVHDENLHSVKLLNQFMDEHYASRGGGSIGWRRLGAPREKVYFSVLVPSLSVKDEEAKRLKRFPLELAANIEAKMVAVLRECGVVVQQSVEEEAASDAGFQHRRVKKRAERRPDGWQQDQGGWTRPSGMDFGWFTMGEMYAKANRAAASDSRRRKKPIQTLKGLLEFMREDETVETQERRQIAWQSIQSVRGTLKRELGLEDVLFSCGWSTMHLNTTVMILLQTLRKYARANKQGIFTPKDFLRGTTINISANPSGIDFSNEYRIGLNPADVPVQWVQVLEAIDANMVVFMKAARESLVSLQTNATTALGEANISRGHTCSALGYRTFLQSMRQYEAEYEDGKQGLLEKFALVIEDESYDWRVLETGQVRAPFTSSYEEAITFLSKNRSQIRQQQEAHDANLEAFAYISSRCADAMHIKNITRDERIPVAEAIVACEELLKAAVGMTPQSSRGFIPQEMMRFLDTYTQGRSMCISRTYGLGQDGVFTLPVDWFKCFKMEEEITELRLQLKAARSDVKRYASYALRLQQELSREKQKDKEDAGFTVLNESYTGPSGTSVWNQKVEKTRMEHVVWSRKIDRLVQILDERNSESVESDAGRDNQMAERVDTVLRSLVPFLQQQRRLVGELGRENAKLRDMLHARPSRRELVTSQLKVERLQRDVHTLRVRAKAGQHEPRGDLEQEQQSADTRATDGAVVKGFSLSERILEERILQMLRVKTENSATQHKYLKEKMRCYLSLNSARLTSKHPGLPEAGILERVGRICSDVVATCCYVLEVEDVGELPHCVDKAYQLANVSTTYQGFLERIEKLLKRFDKDAFYAIRSESSAETSCLEALEMVLAHVNDVLVELDARREQMTPPGSKAHEVLLKNMKLLQVARIDQLAPTIRRLVDNMRAEQEFQRDLRELLGLDEDANRNQILHVASILFGELGFLKGNTPLRQSSTRSSKNTR